MTAFNFNRFQEIRNGLRMMYHRSISYKPFYLSFEQTKKLFLNPEHVEILEKAKELFKVSGEHEFVFNMGEHPGAQFKASSEYLSTTKGAFPFPNYMGATIFVWVDDPIYVKLQEWCAWRARLAYDFTVAIAVLDQFNNTCKTPRVINYLWPSLVPIMRMRSDPSLRKLADKLFESRSSPPEVPGFSPEFKLAANEAAGVVARTQMLSKEHDNAAEKKGKVRITLNVFDVMCPWEPESKLPYWQPMTPDEL